MRITSDRTENARRNTVWAFISRFITMLLPFATRTFLVYQLGAEYLGLNSLYVSILQVLNLAELGFGAAVVYSMYAPVAEGDIRAIAALLSYFKRTYRIIGIVILIVGFLISPFLDFLISGSVPIDVNIRLAFFIYLVNASMSYLLFAYRQCLFDAHQRSDVKSKVALLTQIVQNLGQIAVLTLAPGFYSFALVLPLATMINNFSIAILARRNFPEYFMGEMRLQRLAVDKRGDIRKRVFGLMIQKLCAVTRDSIDSILVSTFFGLVTVGLYSNYFVLMSGVLGLLETIGPAITASVGNSIATEDPEKNYHDLRKFVFLYAMISSVAVSCLLVAFQPFMELWMGTDKMLPNIIPALLCVYFYVRSMGDMLSVYVDGSGIWWQLRWRALLEAVVNVVLDVLLGLLIGLPGIVLATIASLLVVNFGYGSVLIFRHYFGNEKVLVYFFDHLKYACAALAVAAGSFIIASILPLYGVVGLLGKTSVALLCSVAAEFALFFRTDAFKNAIPLIRRIAGRQ